MDLMEDPSIQAYRLCINPMEVCGEAIQIARFIHIKLTVLTRLTQSAIPVMKQGWDVETAWGQVISKFRFEQ